MMICRSRRTMCSGSHSGSLFENASYNSIAMSGFPLSSLLPELGELKYDAAQSWVAATLAQAAALRQHHASLYPRDAARQAAAERLHQAWYAWLDDAKVVLQRCESSGASAPDIPGVAALRDEIARAEALAQLPPSLIARRRQQVERGEVYTLDEVRRELRTGSRR